MTECYVTVRDVRTKFNDLFYDVKIAKVRQEIEELYEMGTTITNFDYGLGFMSIRSYSPEDITLTIMEKEEYLRNLSERRLKYMNAHDKAMESMRGKNMMILHTFQSGFYTYEEVAAMHNLSKERIRQVVNTYRKKLSGFLVSDDVPDQDTITQKEVEQLSAVIEENVMYVLPTPPKDPLHGIAEWIKEQNKKII